MPNKKKKSKKKKARQEESKVMAAVEKIVHEAPKRKRKRKRKKTTGPGFEAGCQSNASCYLASIFDTEMAPPARLPEPVQVGTFCIKLPYRHDLAWHSAPSGNWHMALAIVQPNIKNFMWANSAVSDSGAPSWGSSINHPLLTPVQTAASMYRTTGLSVRIVNVGPLLSSGCKLYVGTLPPRFSGDFPSNSVRDFILSSTSFELHTSLEGNDISLHWIPTTLQASASREDHDGSRHEGFTASGLRMVNDASTGTGLYDNCIDSALAVMLVSNNATAPGDNVVLSTFLNGQCVPYLDTQAIHPTKSSPGTEGDVSKGIYQLAQKHGESMWHKFTTTGVRAASFAGKALVGVSKEFLTDTMPGFGKGWGGGGGSLKAAASDKAGQYSPGHPLSRYKIVPKADLFINIDESKLPDGPSGITPHDLHGRVTDQHGRKLSDEEVDAVFVQSTIPGTRAGSRPPVKRDTPR